MHRMLLAVGLGLLLAAPASAQRATERYVPIGRSPGLSGTWTTLGRVVEVDAAARSVTLEGAPPVRVTGTTRIWLDRSAEGRTNLGGSLADLRPGRLAEVSYRHPDRREADWIKVRVD